MSAPRPVDLWLCEQVEAVAVAIAMALVLKFFLVEAYQIPTGSMQPTILGDAATGIRDRVLADKLCALLRDPRRWEVTIFRFPLDERRLYVKRIVGLPGETLEIHGGDVWIDGQIARKPDRINDSVLKNVFPLSDGGMDLSAFTAGPGVSVAGRAARFTPEATGALTLRASVRADYLHGYDPDWGMAPQSSGNEAVADLELACTAQLDGERGMLELTFSSDEGDLVCRLRPAAGAGGEPAAPGAAVVSFRPAGGGVETTLGSTASAGRVPVGRPFRVLARNVDREFLLQVDGTEWLRLDDDASRWRTEHPSRSLVSLALRGGGQLRDLAIRRDIYYTQRGGTSSWTIPEDSYFALGDNTQGSHDSRGWELQTYKLLDPAAPDGLREVSGFWFPGSRSQPSPDSNPRPLGADRLSFSDIHGDETVFDGDAIVGEDRRPAPFIQRRYVLGKATLVFWPVWHPFRWKLIH